MIQIRIGILLCGCSTGPTANSDGRSRPKSRKKERPENRIETKSLWFVVHLPCQSTHQKLTGNTARSVKLTRCKEQSEFEAGFFFESHQHDKARSINQELGKNPTHTATHIHTLSAAASIKSTPQFDRLITKGKQKRNQPRHQQGKNQKEVTTRQRHTQTQNKDERSTKDNGGHSTLRTQGSQELATGAAQPQRKFVLFCSRFVTSVSILSFLSAVAVPGLT